MVEPKTWALVTDGVRARILRGLEHGNAEEPIELISRARSVHLRGILNDKAGRSFASDTGARRAAMEAGSDPIRRDMQDFARETLDFLEPHLRARDFDRLAIFAAPKMLGILRKQLSATLRHSVILERPVNLIGLSVPDLRGTVLAILRSDPME